MAKMKSASLYGGQGSVIKRLTRKDHKCPTCGAEPRERCVSTRSGKSATGKYSEGGYDKPMKDLHRERGR